MLSENTPAELAALYQTAVEKNDVDAVKHIEKEAQKRVDGFLSGALDVDSDDSPFWLTFVRSFAQTANVDLKMAAKKAEVKLVPLLKEFDADVGFDFSDHVNEATLERNIADLDAFEKINPFEREDFGQILKLIRKISLSTDDGTTYETADFLEDVLEAARLKSFLRLCLNLDKITDELYFFVLKRETEAFLMTLLLAENAEKAFETASQEEVEAEFEKFLDAIE